MAFDVFISYRRDSGAAVARLLRNELHQRGIRTFMDVDDLSAGPFDASLLNAIEAAPNFVVVLGPGDLDRCQDPQDWLRQEWVHATSTHRNIIPYLLPGFELLSSNHLPDGFQRLPMLQNVSHHHVYFSAAVNQLVGYLRLEREAAGIMPQLYDPRLRSAAQVASWLQSRYGHLPADLEIGDPQLPHHDPYLRLVQVFAYEQGEGRKAPLWRRPLRFLHANGEEAGALHQAYDAWRATRGVFTEKDVTRGTWLKISDHGRYFRVWLLPYGRLQESGLFSPGHSWEGTWRLVDGVLRCNVGVYELDVIAAQDDPVHSGIEFEVGKSEPGAYFKVAHLADS